MYAVRKITQVTICFLRILVVRPFVCVCVLLLFSCLFLLHPIFYFLFIHLLIFLFSVVHIRNLMVSFVVFNCSFFIVFRIVDHMINNIISTVYYYHLCYQCCFDFIIMFIIIPIYDYDTDIKNNMNFMSLSS